MEFELCMNFINANYKHLESEKTTFLNNIEDLNTTILKLQNIVIEKEENHKEMMSVSNIIKINNSNTQLIVENGLLLKKIHYLQGLIKTNVDKNSIPDTIKETNINHTFQKHVDNNTIIKQEKINSIEEFDNATSKENPLTDDEGEEEEEIFEVVKIKKIKYWKGEDQRIYKFTKDGEIGEELGTIIKTNGSEIIRWKH
jgi:hypothetical protein